MGNARRYRLKVPKSPLYKKPVSSAFPVSSALKIPKLRRYQIDLEPPPALPPSERCMAPAAQTSRWPWRIVRPISTAVAPMAVSPSAAMQLLGFPSQFEATIRG